MLTIDKILNISFGDFMNFRDNETKYKNYDIIGINVIKYGLGNYEDVLPYISGKIPSNTELIINFYMGPAKSGEGSGYTIFSGIALVPKPNDQGGSNVNNS